MSPTERASVAEGYLRQAIELHKLSQRNLANDYLALRRRNKLNDVLWKNIEAHLELMKNGDSQAQPETDVPLVQESANAAPKAAARTRKR